MAQMAQPYRHPKTGSYYLRRQIPETLRPAFGGQTLYKRSLGTKDFVRAAQLFIGLNAKFEQALSTARDRLTTTGDPRPSQRDQADNLVLSYFQGNATDGGLDGPERLLLTFLEVDRGITAAQPFACLTIEPSSADRWSALSNNAALFRDHLATQRAGIGRPPAKVWREHADGDHEAVRLVQAARIAEQIARYAGLAVSDLPDGIAERILAYLDEVRLPSENLTRKPVALTSRLRPTMRLRELYAEWRQATDPTPQTALEFSRSIDDLIDFVGDIPAEDLSEDDLALQFHS